MHNPQYLKTATAVHVGRFDPAVSLTEDLPQGVDADILLLGCGDVRDILYTVFVERGLPERELDFTVCDVDEFVIARNVLLFTILLDHGEDVSLRQAWHIYYDFYLEEPNVRLIESQAEKLYNLSYSIQAWHASPYGTTLRFCDERTLSLVHGIWSKYSHHARWRDPARDRDRWTAFQRCLDDAKSRHSHARQVTRQAVSRSCAPLAMEMSSDLLSITEQHWETGISGNPPTTKPEIPNPIFVVPLTATSELKYPTNPLLSFHLAAAQANLTELSPLYLEQHDPVSSQANDRLFDMALMQFEIWVDAFVEAVPRVTVRFTASECVAFCYTLRYNSKTGEICAHHYRGKSGFDVLRLAESEYGAPGCAPKQFDIVDTSGLFHRISILDLLLSVGPLLKESPSSTLYTAGRHRIIDQGNYEELLYGHTTTISLLLGLVPSEYWTNAKAVSMADQVLTACSNDNATSEGRDAILKSRITWKRSTHMADQPSLSPLQTKVHDLVTLLCNLYNIFTNREYHLKNAQLGGSKLPVSGNSPISHSPYQLTTIVSLIYTICDGEDIEPAQVWEELLRRVHDEDRTRFIALRQLAALAMNAPNLIPSLSSGLPASEAQSTMQPAFTKWSSIPNTLAVTVVVPFKSWKQLTQISTRTDQRGEPVVELLGHLRFRPKKNSSPGGEEKHYFGIRISFGNITTRGSRDQDDFAIHMREDEAGWNGTSPMVVSYFVPTDYVRATYGEATVGLTAVNLASDDTSSEIKPGFTNWVHEALIHDEEQAFVTRYPPFQAGHGATEGILRSMKEPRVSSENAASLRTILMADFDASGDIVSITGRVNVTSDQAKQMLADKVPIKVKQASPFTIDIAFTSSSNKELLKLPLTFPAPVLQDGSKTRIARKSCYIEITAPLAKLSAHPAILDTYLLPIANNPSPHQPPSTFNIPHLNLDALPILSLSDKSRSRFLTTLTSLMFSTRERQLREQAFATPPAAAATTTTTTPSARLDFKESLFTIFMLSSGLQGGQTGLFALTRGGDEGIHALLFVSAVRLDSAHGGGAVLDAAVLPLTRALVASGELAEFLLVLRTLECCTLEVGKEELVLWKRALPALAERCRTWSHSSEGENGCEYYEKGRVPVSLVEGEQVLCRCGQGKLPEAFISLPEWETAAKYATRIAISPMYASVLVEELIDPGLAKAVAEEMVGGKLAVKRCRNCQKPETEEGVSLKKCMRCLEVLYCSPECQKKDWKKHRMECEESEVYREN
ncbi:hypothetical protein VTI28DRAFT_6422 [Corynascus sepedonium]